MTSWQAARNGLTGDAEAVNQAAQVAQFLFAHGITPVYTGSQLVTPAGNVGFAQGGIDWLNLGSVDVDQPFTLPSGTTVGRVTLPLSPVGGGADVQVSLYTDSGGSPNTLITQAILPASHLAQLAAPQGLASGGPLATGASNTMRCNDTTVVAWATPVSDAGAAAFPAVAQSGNYLILAGGEVGGTTASKSVFTVGWQGGAAPGTVLPQPPLPVATTDGTLVVTADVAVLAGGVTNLGTFAPLATVWVAGWSPDSGQLQSWAQGPNLPVATFNANGAFDPATDTVYVLGGEVTGPVFTAAVWYAQAVNGQLGAWKAGPSLPAPMILMAAAVVNGWLVVAGGQTGAATSTTGTWLARVQADGSLAPWQAGPPAPYSLAPQGGASNVGGGFTATTSGLVAANFGGGQLMAFTVTGDGAGSWTSQADNSADSGGAAVAAFALAAGQWQLVTIFINGGGLLANGGYSSGVLASVPAISVPLPTTGLTASTTYHVVLHQLGGSAASYVQAAVDPHALATVAKTRPASGGSWTGLSNGYSLLAGIWDLTPVPPLQHLWEDSGTRVTTLLHAGTGGQLLGVVEATQFPSGSPESVFAAVTEIQYGSGGLPTGTLQLA